MPPTSLAELSVMRDGVLVPMLGDYNPVEHGVSVTILQDFLECREQVKFRVNRVQSRADSLALTFGGVGHDILSFAHNEIRTGKLKKMPHRKKVVTWIEEAEHNWKKQHTAASAKALQNLELSCGFLEAVMPMYFDTHKDTLFAWEWLAVEDWFNVDYPITLDDGTELSIEIKGKLDGLYKLAKYNYVFESKFKSRFDTGVMADTLELDLQVLLYMYCIGAYYDIDIRGTTYNIVRRPGLRQGKKETFVAYIKRCVDDVKARPDFYFVRIPMVYSKQKVNSFETVLDSLLKDFYLWSVGAIGDYKNPGACEKKWGTCSFLPICSRGDWSGHVIKEKRR